MNSTPNFEMVRARREEISTIASRYGAHNLRVYGSVARGDATSASDVDFLVDFEPGRSLFDLVRLADELGELMGRSVDIVTEEELGARTRDQILANARSL